MAFSIYDASVPICGQILGALAGIMDKTAAHCAANKITESALLTDRLFPDMFPLGLQIRQSVNFGCNTPARLAGVAMPDFPATDDASFADAKKRCEAARDFVLTLTRAQLEGSEDKIIEWQAGPNQRKMMGAAYLQQFALPNFLFFATTTYDILRHRGVPVGKMDFLGKVAFL